MTNFGWKKDPIKFFPNFEFTPVFPPIEESTCDNKVVGILMKLIPRFKILAVKAATSPIIPPPNAMIVSDLLKFYFNNFSNNLFDVLSDFIFSLGLISNKKIE